MMLGCIAAGWRRARHYAALAVPAGFTLATAVEVAYPDVPPGRWLAINGTLAAASAAGLILHQAHDPQGCPRCTAERPFLTRRLNRLKTVHERRLRVVGQHYVPHLCIVLAVKAWVVGVAVVAFTRPANPHHVEMNVRVIEAACLWWAASAVIYHSHFRDRCVRCGRRELRRNQRAFHKSARSWLPHLPRRKNLDDH
jgi:hypothetical protein